MLFFHKEKWVVIIMVQNNQMDMLHGPLLGKIFRFALPVAAGSILQQFFNATDASIAGRFAGSNALAAVGGNSFVISLMINLFVGITVGANVLIAEYIGKGEKEKVNEAVHGIIAISLICGFLLLGMGQFVARPILILIDTPSGILDLAVLYLRIYFLGMPFFMLYNFGSAILRSVGDTKTPLHALIFSGVFNICLNLLLVVVFRMSVAGVAIATVASEILSAGFVIYRLTSEKGMLHLDFKNLNLNKNNIIKVLQVGLPAGIQGLIFSFANVCIQSAINGFGTAAVAGSAAALNFEWFSYYMTVGFAQAATTFTSQNYAAKEYERCKKICWITILCGAMMNFVMSFSFVMGRDFFLQFFTTSPDVAHYATIRLLQVELFHVLIIFYEIPAGLLRGMGKSITPAVMIISGTCLLRIVWVYLAFPKQKTVEFLFLAYPLSWIVTGILVSVAYFIIRKRMLNKNTFIE